MRQTHRTDRSRAGFTLIEMIVTVSIIILVASMALPTIAAMFSAGADSQAYNLISAQLAAARAMAIQETTYAGVHVQLADSTATGNERLEGVCFSAIVKYASPDFELVEGYPPQRLPSGIAFGEISDTFIDGEGDYDDTAFTNEAVGADAGNDGSANFTSFTVVFSPTGTVVAQVGGADISFATGGPFENLWAVPAAEAGVTAMTLFQYGQLVAREDSAGLAGRAAYLDESGQFLPVNVYTGQIVARR